MDLADFILHEDLKISCSVCSSPLSYFPIYLTADRGDVCGRCINHKREVGIHNEAFEALAKNLLFPCRYKDEGCMESLLPKDMPQHEQCCSFKIVECPARYAEVCSWRGAKPKVFHHCQDKHSELVLKSGEFDFQCSTCPEDVEHYMEHNSVMFVISRRFDPAWNLLQLSVSHMDYERGGQQVPYQISLKFDDRELTIQKQTTDYADKILNRIFLESLTGRREPSYDKISVKITLGYESPSTALTNEKLLSHLKCEHCLGYIMPPTCDADIFSRNKKCLKCTDNIKQANCLIEIAKLLHYPCENKKDGCNFVGIANDIKDHQRHCSKKQFNCPVILCAWCGTWENLNHHVQESHSDMIIISSSLISARVLQKPGINESSAEDNNFKMKPEIALSGPTFFKADDFAESDSPKISFGFSPFLTESKEVEPAIFSPKVVVNSTTNLGNANPAFLSIPSVPPIGYSKSQYADDCVQETEKSFEERRASYYEVNTAVNSTIYFLLFMGHLFFVNFTVKDRQLRWFVQTDAFYTKFNFEVELVNKINTRQSLILRHPCTLMGDFSDCLLYRDIIFSYITEGEITFKIHVFK